MSEANAQEQEREFRRLKWAIRLTWLGWALAFAWVFRDPPTWSGRRVEIIDSGGTVRAVLTADGDGASLSMGSGGSLRLSAPDGHSPELQIGGPTGTLLQPGRVVLGGWDAGAGVVLDAAGPSVEVRAPPVRATLEASTAGARLILTDGASERVYTPEVP